jgi:hypothetical protein
VLLVTDGDTGEVRATTALRLTTSNGGASGGVGGRRGASAKAAAAAAALGVTVDVTQSALYLRHLYPLPAATAAAGEAATLVIHDAVLDSVTITGDRSVIEDVAELTTTTLTVKDFGDFRGDVIVGGSVNVRGSVIGRGPYVDSSDRRLKTNIAPLTTTTTSTTTTMMDKVMHLRAVSCR